MSTLDPGRDALNAALTKRLKNAHSSLIRREIDDVLRASGANVHLLAPGLVEKAEILDVIDAAYVRIRDGDDLITVEKAVEKLRADATMRGAFSAGRVPNPFQKGPTWNLTEQMRLQRVNPSLAATLKAKAEALV
jgi:hypothetical protein